MRAATKALAISRETNNLCLYFSHPQLITVLTSVSFVFGCCCRPRSHLPQNGCFVVELKSEVGDSRREKGRFQESSSSSSPQPSKHSSEAGVLSRPAAHRHVGCLELIVHVLIGDGREFLQWGHGQNNERRLAQFSFRWVGRWRLDEKERLPAVGGFSSSGGYR
jgi:hypothetical protein